MQKNKLYTDTLTGLKEAVEISRGDIPLKEKVNMPAQTFTADMETNKSKLNTYNE